MYILELENYEDYKKALEVMNSGKYTMKTFLELPVEKQIEIAMIENRNTDTCFKKNGSQYVGCFNSKDEFLEFLQMVEVQDEEEMKYAIEIISNMYEEYKEFYDMYKDIPQARAGDTFQNSKFFGAITIIPSTDNSKTFYDDRVCISIVRYSSSWNNW